MVLGFAGTFNIEKVIPEWFGAKGDNSTINTKPFQDAIDFAFSILKVPANPIVLNILYGSAVIIVLLPDSVPVLILPPIDFAEFAATNVEFQSGDYVIDGTLYIRKQSRIHITGMGKYKTFIYLKTTTH